MAAWRLWTWFYHLFQTEKITYRTYKLKFGRPNFNHCKFAQINTHHQSLIIISNNIPKDLFSNRCWLWFWTNAWMIWLAIIFFGFFFLQKKESNNRMYTGFHIIWYIRYYSSAAVTLTDTCSTSFSILWHSLFMSFVAHVNRLTCVHSSHA